MNIRNRLRLIKFYYYFIVHYYVRPETSLDRNGFMNKRNSLLSLHDQLGNFIAGHFMPPFRPYTCASK